MFTTEELKRDLDKYLEKHDMSISENLYQSITDDLTGNLYFLFMEKNTRIANHQSRVLFEFDKIQNRIWLERQHKVRLLLEDQQYLRNCLMERLEEPDEPRVIVKTVYKEVDSDPHL